MTRTLAWIVAAALVAATPASARERPLVSLTATPARVALDAGSAQVVTLRNVGVSPLVVDAAASGLHVDVRGVPSLRGRSRGAAAWLRVTPQRLTVPRGALARLVVAAAIPRRVRPGDHVAAVVLTSRRVEHARVGVRMRIGIRVLVRVPGPVTRGLAVRSMRIARGRRERLLRVLLLNRGDIVEELAGRVHVRVRSRAGSARVACGAAELLPRSLGTVECRYRGRIRGRATVVVTLRGGRTRTFAVRL